METILKIIQFIKNLHLFPIEISKWYLLRGNLFIGLLLLILMSISVIVIDILVLYFIIMMIRGTIIILRTREIKKDNVKGILTKRNYREGYYQVVVTGKTVVPVYHSAIYEIYVGYNGEELCFESEEKYKTLKEGDKVELVRIRRLDKNQRIIDTEYELD